MLIRRSASISECGRYRWWLKRSWDYGHDFFTVVAEPFKQNRSTVVLVMLNPSKADANQEDPTLRRCIGFAQYWGFDDLIVKNLFSWRATDPNELTKLDRETAIGCPRTDEELMTLPENCVVVVAWGTGGTLFGRDKEVLDLFAKHHPERKLLCLGTTKDGHPRHPLFVCGQTQLVEFKA